VEGYFPSVFVRRYSLIRQIVYDLNLLTTRQPGCILSRLSCLREIPVRCGTSFDRRRVNGIGIISRTKRSKDGARPASGSTSQNQVRMMVAKPRNRLMPLAANRSL